MTKDQIIETLINDFKQNEGKDQPLNESLKLKSIQAFQHYIDMTKKTPIERMMFNHDGK